MKKLIISIAAITILTGCSINNKLTKTTPTEVVEEYFSNYQTLNTDVLTQLNETINNRTDLTDAQKADYLDIMKKHYKDLRYEIKDEKIDGDTATVTTEITVKDYSKILSDADTYLADNPEQFNDKEGKYDVSLFNDYRIGKIKEAEDTATYTLELTLTKTDNEWILDGLTDADENKIQGNYIA